MRRYGVIMRRPRSARGKKGLNNPVRLALLLLFAALALAAVTWLAGKPSAELKAAGGIGRFRSFTSLWNWHKKQEEAWPETLVVYIFSNTDPEYLNNLNFFLKWGVREGDGAYYIIVVQEGGKSPVRLATTSSCNHGLCLSYSNCHASSSYLPVVDVLLCLRQKGMSIGFHSVSLYLSIRQVIFNPFLL